MSRDARTPHDWLTLVQGSGLVVTEPVLEEAFPQGSPDVERGALHAFRRRFERWRLARAEHERLVKRGQDPRKARQRIRGWIDFVLEDFLGHPAGEGGSWAKGPAVPDSCRVVVENLTLELRPDRVLEHRGKPALLVAVVDPDQPLGRRDRTTGRWKVTPAARLERLLRDSGHPLGVVTNGEEWRLLFCPSKVSTGWLGFGTRLLFEEPSVLRAFRMLVGRDLLRPEDPKAETLVELCEQSLRRQSDVADRLGRQVRDGLELLPLAIDRADRRCEGGLLAGRSEDAVYEMALVVLMRLVFLLYAEEHRLLPHGQVLYDQGYGVSHLWRELRERQASLDEDFDAWDRILATSRLVHRGCDHEDLSLLAYGGRLFDPDRFPELEDARCRVPNRTVERILDCLLFARARKGGARQRVGYWSLDVEEIGYLYEGLLDHAARRAGAEPVVKLRGGGEEAWSLAELEGREGDELLDFVLSGIGKKPKEGERAKLRRRTEAWREKPVAADLEGLARLSREVRERVEPLAPYLQCREVAEPGARYLTLGTSRRASGAHYTPAELTQRIVETTLEPLVYVQEEGKPGVYVQEGGQRILKEPRELLALKVADIAMGSGAFLVQVVRWLGDRLVEAWDRCAHRAEEGVVLAQPHGEPSADPGQDLLVPFEDRDAMVLWARRQVASRCVYGVDKNPLAVEMAKLSLWLVTLSRDHPFTFLDHALKCGDSLVGVSREQMERGSMERGGDSTPPLGTDFLLAAVREATEAREGIRQMPVIGPEDARIKEAALKRAEAATEKLRLAGDLLVAPEFAESRKRDREELRATLVGRFAEEASEGEMGELRTRVQGLLGPERPFHFFVEFPEVFEQGGFDAIVGNPPFAGGQKLTEIFGESCREYWIRHVGRGKRGSADLVSYFFLRAGDLLRPKGHTGLLATNTVAQGDTRENGLDQLVAAGFVIRAAVKSTPWPGEATLEVSTVHMARGKWRGPLFLTSRQVPSISSSLDTGSDARPHRLKANEGKSFQGSNVLGLGFTMSPDEAREWIKKDPHNAHVLHPYLNAGLLTHAPRFMQPSAHGSAGKRRVGLAPWSVSIAAPVKALHTL